ncbi:MAG: bis(5'-nucleosyl)-tetraphosphatase (symmetrical) [Coxiella sp. RIFCSPHIGHO2_12_FULL_42_15]|nr:MAG: bis(5'-nucleosyl)-tetraphosphatase (symmetrical) [Coxiella sp. RIFCSPHIGHO2_12_FULL_42_15]
MATYIIGDLQGCYRELQDLLERINYNPDRDHLGFVGDLVNRGPESLTVLRFLKKLRHISMVLGNHDLYLLILGYRLMPIDSYQHTLHEVIEAPDRLELLDWLRHQSIAHFSKAHNSVMVHAGIAPQWSIKESLSLARELELILQGPHFLHFLRDLFGNEPATWNPNLEGQARWRYLTNAFTRMRFCTQAGELEFAHFHPIYHNDRGFKPWFEWRTTDEPHDIFFGHWAMLGGRCDHPTCFALDTGCAWGETLTALRLEDRQRFSVPARS